MFDLNSGELFVSIFILTTIVSAPLWPRAGEWIATRLARVEAEQDDEPPA